MEDTLDLVTASGAAKILGWKDRRQVNLYIERKKFPDHFIVANTGLDGVKVTKLWHRKDIEAWKAERGQGKKGKVALGDE